MLGKTNATTGGSSSGGAGIGGEIEVINKTGLNITTGDKVWINENAQTAGTSFDLSAGNNKVGFITRTGNNFYSDQTSRFYSVTSSGLTELKTFGVSDYARGLKYMANGTTFLAPVNSNANSARIDENAQAIVPDSYCPICDDLFKIQGRNWYLYKLNLDTFEEVKGWYFENNALTSDNIFIIGNKLYVQGKMFELPENGGTIPSGTTGTTVSGLPSLQWYMGVTSDGKYLLTCYSNSLTNGNTLTIHEVVNDTTFRLVQASELPAEFEPFYNGTSKPVCIFNPYTGVLTCVVPQTQQYLVAKYENGSWNVLPITLNHEGDDLQCLTVADDLSRVCYLSGTTSNYKHTIANLETASGYVAVPYKTYNINDKTLTGVAKTDASVEEVLTAIIGGDVTEVYNQDKTITENGTYTADVGYTGLGIVTVNVESSGGDTVTAINKTGAVINEGDKVWLQKDAQVGDNYYFLEKGTSNRTEFFITRTGDYAFSGHQGLYKVDNGFSKTNNFTQQYSYHLRYMDNGTTFITRNLFSGGQSARVDDNLVSNCSTYIPICKNYFLKNNINWYLHKLNLDTFAEEGGWYFENNALTSTSFFIIGDRLYIGTKMFRLPEGGGTIPSGTTGESVTGLSNTGNVCGTTFDGKFVIFCNSNSLTSTGTLKIYEAVNDTTFRYVELRELPPEFEYFYNKNTCYAIFNPYTGVLTCTINGTRRYLIAQYVDGAWKILKVKISVDNTNEDYPVTNLYGALTVSDSLNRIAAIRVNVNNGNCYLVYDTKAVSGYSALSYKVYNLDSTTLTGKAKASAEIGAEVEVSTVLPNDVDVTVTASEDNVTLSME